MRDQRLLSQLRGELTREECDEVMERVRKAMEDYRVELEREFGLFLDFPTDDNQRGIQDRCTRYRHLWMRAHDRPDEVEEEE